MASTIASSAGSASGSQPSNETETACEMKAFQVPMSLEITSRVYGSKLRYFSARVTVTNIDPSDVIFYPGRDNSHVLQYLGEQVTGFLNLGVPGNILFGIQRNGRVEGSSLFPHQEDMIRTILGTMLRYDVTPEPEEGVVCVAFDPVRLCPPHAMRPQGSARKVMNIIITPNKFGSRLTYFKDRVYIRELGEVHRLTESELRLYLRTMETQSGTDNAMTAEARGVLQCSRGLLTRFGILD